MRRKRERRGSHQREEWRQMWLESPGRRAAVAALLRRQFLRRLLHAESGGEWRVEWGGGERLVLARLKRGE
jgi:hypothetical protein